MKIDAKSPAYMALELVGQGTPFELQGSFYMVIFTALGEPYNTQPMGGPFFSDLRLCVNLDTGKAVTFSKNTFVSACTEARLFPYGGQPVKD